MLSNITIFIKKFTKNYKFNFIALKNCSINHTKITTEYKKLFAIYDGLRTGVGAGHFSYNIPF